jgi:hypothetical protein
MNTPFVSCLDEDELADLKREAALQWHERDRRCPECGHHGFHAPRCPERQESEEDEA